MKKILLSLVAITSLMNALARPTIHTQPRPGGLNKTASGCENTTAKIDLDINNVRAQIMTGGDMWWDIQQQVARYEVPKNSRKNALFAGSLWIAGKDASGVKVAAQTYRQRGNDYWTGPLDGVGSISFQTCTDWDRFWKINATDINKFRSLYDETDTSVSQRKAKINANLALVPEIIREWPAQGNKDSKNSSGGPLTIPNKNMAPFVDIDKNNEYDWRSGDYPKIKGDQFIWWVFNDKGGAKTQTQTDGIGLEVHASAFAFATNDCLNEATFYNYKIHVYGSSILDSTYLATFSDADLGYFKDDFVGCDTSRGLGILYNGDAFDEGATGYEDDIPMVGVDYFEGPIAKDPITGKDTQLKMTSFTYFNNVNDPGISDPDFGIQYYYYMTGRWKDGLPFTVSNTGRGGTVPTKFLFYGDPCVGGWNEVASGNTPDDRRFVHSSGPFVLEPGSTNNVTIGAIWVPSVGGASSACFGKIKICDDKAQELFDNKFKLLSGPEAPTVVVQPLDKKLVFDLDNLSSSNNFKFQYGTNVKDPKYYEIVKKAKDVGSIDTVYKFEGYVVYQLKSPTIALSDLRDASGAINTDVAREVFQCDKKNGIKEIINFERNPAVSTEYFVPKRMVEGKDQGIKNSFQITTDAFATGQSRSLVNYKTYYYIVIAYAHNNFAPFDQKKFDKTQDKPYLESRTGANGTPIKVIAAMPHPATDSLYIQTYAEYGTGLQLKRIEGKGNGGIPMEMTEASEAEAVSTGIVKNPIYKPNLGPMVAKVVNPDSVKPGNYEVWFKVDSSYTDNNDTSKGARPEHARWYIVRLNNGSPNDTIWSDVNLSEYSEKYMRRYLSPSSSQLDLGIALAAQQVNRPGDDATFAPNGFIDSKVLYEDVNYNWLSGVKDQDGATINNWILAGTETGSGSPNYQCLWRDWDESPSVLNKDRAGVFEKVVNGTFAPYNLVSSETRDECRNGLMFTNDRNNNRLADVYSIDLVFTKDKSMWTRCAVIEMTENIGTVAYGQNGALKYCLRKHPGWNGDVDADGKPVYSTNPSDSGMSWFPGYAINVETGERLNISFGEESFNGVDNGRDMIWNPTSRERDAVNFALKWGGRHIIYIHRTRYVPTNNNADHVNNFVNELRKNVNSTGVLRGPYRSMMWVGVPLLQAGRSFNSLKDGLIPTKTRVQIRVNRPYAQFIPDPNTPSRNNGWPLYSFSTNDIAPAAIGDTRNNYTNNKDEALKRIFIVPNPYYAYSEYENTRVDTRVRIVNLPDKATIKIYTLDGSLVKTINKNDNKTAYVDWDIKNDKGIPVASGMYLVHVNLPGIGETVLKWFGALRPTDLTSF